MNVFVQLLSMASKASNVLKNSSFLSTSVDVTTEGVDDMLQLMDHYGPVMVLMAIFFVIFIILMVCMIRSNNKLIAHTIDSDKHADVLEGNILSKLVDAILAASSKKTDEQSSVEQDSDKSPVQQKEIQNIANDLKDKITGLAPQSNNPNDNDYNHDLVGAYIDVNIALKDASRRAVNSLNCSRLGIYVFHNGNKSMLGLPFFKMSCIHEWNSRGQNTLRSRSHIDMPLHLFNGIVEDIYKYGFYKSQNVDITVQKDNSIREFLAYSDTKAFYFDAIRNKDNIPSGFIVAEFNSFDTFDSDVNRDKEVKDILDLMVAEVQPIVGCPYIYKRVEKSDM